MYSVSKVTAHGFVDVANTTVLRITVKWPENKEEIVELFYVFGGMPEVCGCLNYILINIDTPKYNKGHFQHCNQLIACMVVYVPDLGFMMLMSICRVHAQMLFLVQLFLEYFKEYL